MDRVSIHAAALSVGTKEPGIAESLLFLWVQGNCLSYSCRKGLTELVFVA